MTHKIKKKKVEHQQKIKLHVNYTMTQKTLEEKEKD